MPPNNKIATAMEKESTKPFDFISTYASPLSCVMYSCCSISMVLMNKAVPVYVPIEYRDKIPQYSVISFQCIVAVFLVELSRYLGYVEYSSFTFATARKLLPLNILFIGMLLSGFMSLVYISVPVVTVFKNLANIATLLGDWYIFGEM